MGAIQYHTVEVTAGGDLFSITFLQTCAESGTAGLCSPGSAPVLVIILFLTNNKIVSSTDYCVIQYVLGFFSMLTLGALLCFLCLSRLQSNGQLQQSARSCVTSCCVLKGTQFACSCILWLFYADFHGLVINILFMCTITGKQINGVVFFTSGF